jgi:hypothetical protein
MVEIVLFSYLALMNAEKSTTTVKGAKNKKEFYFKLDFFAGAQFSGSLMGKKVRSVLASYVCMYETQQ